MERITNVRISTLTKSVSHDGDVSIVVVGLNNGHVFAVDSEGNTHDMGAIIISNIEIATPQVASEGCGCNTPNANVIAKLLRGVDGITPDMSDYYQKREVDSRLKEKQDVIRDLETIRSGAAKGATAVQPASLADYVSKDDVDAELSETSTNPIQNQAVMNTLLTLEEVLGGILEQKQPVISDLEAIREGAAKGATALQASDVDSEVLGTSANPVQNKAVAGAFNEIVGLLDATLSSVDGRFDSKQDKLVSGENIKTINGESIVGEGDIVIKGGSADLEGYATEDYVDNAVAEVNVKGEDGYVYSNGEKVDMRFTRSLLPVGTSIPKNANLNTKTYLKIGKYYCSLNVDAQTITNCPIAEAFSMEVFNPLGTNVDDEDTNDYTYRIRRLTHYKTGIEYIQYCNTSGTAGSWTYGSWYVSPITKATMQSDKNGSSLVLGGGTQGIYIKADGTFAKMSCTLGKSVPSNAEFTDTKVTAVGNHYAPVENENVAIEAPAGEVVIGLKRDAAGHVVGVTSTPMSSGGGGGGGIAVETDPVFSASPAASITEDDKEAWNNKVSYSAKDFSMVRADGFMTSEGDGFVFPNTPAAQAEQGFVLATLDDIPNAITEADITAMGFTKNTGTYSKPSGGIPESDLAEEVKGALRKAEQYTGTVTEIKVNGNNIGASGGVVDLGNLGTYSKPSTGIPKSDLNPSVQTSLGKADTAVQPADIKDVVYIADFTLESLKRGMKSGTYVDCNMQALVTAMNANQVILVREGEDSSYKGVYVLNGFAEDLLYFSIVDSSGNILWCDGTNYTDASYIDAQTLYLHSWWEKQAALVSGENIKTINGESIVGSGNITISGSGSAQLPLNTVIKILNGSTLAIPSGKVTELAFLQTGGGTFALSADKKFGEDNVWVIRFSISIDNLGIYQVVADEGYSIKWANGVAPTFEKGKFYELSFRLVGQTFLGVWASFE